MGSRLRALLGQCSLASSKLYVVSLRSMGLGVLMASTGGVQRPRWCLWPGRLEMCLISICRCQTTANSPLGLFIIDGLITVPIGLLGFLIMPDLPHNTPTSWIYTKEHLAIGRKRMKDIGRKPPAKFTKKKVRWPIS